MTKYFSAFAAATILAAAVFTLSALMPDEAPQAEIRSGNLYARLYLPDTGKGYYRATRFDWAGVIPELKYKDHSYTGLWYDRYSPTINDALMGPVESFTPLGYDQAKPGGSFVQIGVGLLERADSTKYHIFKYYKILDAGKWAVKKKSDQVEFIHTLRDSIASYEYHKKVQLVSSSSSLVLSHSLKNIGKTPIESDVYDHNLFVIDKQLTGPGAEISFPFTLKGEQTSPNFGSIAEMTDKQIKILKFLGDRESTYTILTGYSQNSSDYDIRIEDHKTGAAMRIRSDQPLSKLAFWCNPRTYCPEPFIHVSVKPGETFNWKISYEFYTCAIRK